MLSPCGCVAGLRWVAVPGGRRVQIGLRACSEHLALTEAELAEAAAVADLLYKQEPGTTSGAILASFLERVRSLGAVA